MARTFARYNREQRSAYIDWLNKLPDAQKRLERLNALVAKLKEEGHFETTYWGE